MAAYRGVSVVSLGLWLVGQATGSDWQREADRRGRAWQQGRRPSVSGAGSRPSRRGLLCCDAVAGSMADASSSGTSIISNETAVTTSEDMLHAAAGRCWVGAGGRRRRRQWRAPRLSLLTSVNEAARWGSAMADESAVTFWRRGLGLVF